MQINCSRKDWKREVKTGRMMSERIWGKCGFRIAVWWLWIEKHDRKLLSRQISQRVVAPAENNKMWNKDSNLQGFPALLTGPVKCFVRTHKIDLF
jgi:hypothetical protein